MAGILRTWIISVDRDERDTSENLGLDKKDFDTEKLEPLYLKIMDISAMNPNTIRFQGVDDVPCTDVYMSNGIHHLCMTSCDILEFEWRKHLLGTDIANLPKSIE